MPRSSSSLKLGSFRKSLGNRGKFTSQLQNRLTCPVEERRGSSPQPSSDSSVNPSEQGLTLIECLVAIVVIGLTIAMIAPPLVISAATRVQNRRAEQSLQIAQGEIDRVRALVTRDQHQPGVIPAVVASVQTYGAPTGASALLRSSRATCNTYTGQQIAANQILRIDVDGDCRADFMMQAFRTAGTTVVGQPLVSEFQMGVRVYSILADNNWNNLGIQQASLKITSGSGNQRTRPLAVLYSNFARSDQGNTLCFYQTGQSLGTSCN